MTTTARARMPLRRALMWLPVAGAVVYWLASGGSSRYEIREVDVAQGKALVDAGAVVIDARAADRFAYRHLPGAISLPLAAIRLGIPASFTVAKDARILVYCGDGLTIGPEATSLLNQAGYVNAVNLKPGIEGWAAAGLPVQQSPG
jgi:rhodanese-related sulfurtransferase